MGDDEIIFLGLDESAFLSVERARQRIHMNTWLWQMRSTLRSQLRPGFPEGELKPQKTHRQKPLLDCCM